MGSPLGSFKEFWGSQFEFWGSQVDFGLPRKILGSLFCILKNLGVARKISGSILRNFNKFGGPQWDFWCSHGDFVKFQNFHVSQSFWGVPKIPGIPQNPPNPYAGPTTTIAALRASLYPFKNRGASFPALPPLPWQQGRDHESQPITTLGCVVEAGPTGLSQSALAVGVAAHAQSPRAARGR